MIRLPPRSTRPYTRCPYATLFRSPVLVHLLYQHPDLRSPQHGHFLVGGPAGRLCVFALSLLGRQTRFFLAVDQPHDAAGRFPASVLPALFHAGPYGYLLGRRSEEHTSELQSLMRISYAVFCLKNKTNLRDANHHVTAHESFTQHTVSYQTS